MRQPTQDEIEGLYTRVSNFVSGRLRNSNSPSLATRPQVHCKVLSTHYKVVLTGFNQARFNEVNAMEMSDAFPGWEVAWLAEPGNSNMEYALLIPLECALVGRFSRKKGRSENYGVPSGGGSGPGIERLLLLFFVCIALGLGSYQFLLLPMLK